MSYDRYKQFRVNGHIEVVPGITIDPKDTDYFETYILGQSRLDIISNDYYGDPNYDWLIMLANPEYGSLEYKIPDGVILRIPYPLSATLENYNNKIIAYKTLYN
jgi:hypothetical protein